MPLFPNFMRMITQFGLHNMRGSEEGAEAIIAVTVKGLAEECGLRLCNAQLALGCPSCQTLARNKRRLIADVLVSVVQEMLRDGVQCIGLMVDHGKRSGIECFVKMLVWAVRDENRRQILKYFCLDVDRSNHSASDCADVIKMSIEKLHVAEKTWRTAKRSTQLVFISNGRSPNQRFALLLLTAWLRWAVASRWEISR